MQAVMEKQSREKAVHDFNFEIPEALNCFQIKEKLDALFEGDSPLEETHQGVKRILFGHLETCQKCCRSFDVLVRFRPSGRDRIF